MLRCGPCGNRLFSRARHNNPQNRVRRYVCLKGPDHGGCGRLTVVALPVEELLTDAVLTRLDSPQLAEALDGKARVDADVAALATQLEADQARLDELAGLYAEGAVSAREWIAARDPINDRITQARRDIANATDTTSVVDRWAPATCCAANGTTSTSTANKPSSNQCLITPSSHPAPPAPAALHQSCPASVAHLDSIGCPCRSRLVRSGLSCGLACAPHSFNR